MSTKWTLTRKTGPSERPLSLSEAKAALNLADSDATHDATITQAIDAATEQIEQDTDRVIIDQTFIQSGDSFPAGGASIPIAIKPVSSIVSIKALGTDGNDLTIDPGVYALDTGRREVHLQFGQTWPEYQVFVNSVRIELVAGYGADSSYVPRLIKQAMQLQVGRWFYDPAMENAESYSKDIAYERIINKLLRTSYP